MTDRITAVDVWVMTGLVGLVLLPLVVAVPVLVGMVALARRGWESAS
jgi:O-antigen ligase